MLTLKLPATDSCNKTSAVGTCFYLRCLSAVKNKGFGDMITTLEPRYTVSPDNISQTSLSKVVPRSHSDSPGLPAQQTAAWTSRSQLITYWSVEPSVTDEQTPFQVAQKVFHWWTWQGFFYYIVYLDEFFKQFHFSCIAVYVKVT